MLYNKNIAVVIFILKGPRRMKTLSVYYSLTGKTERLVRFLREADGTERLKLRQTHDYSLPGAYLFGAARARSGKGAQLRPVDLDISEFDRIVLAGPVWAGAPAPALTGFLRSYDLTGREVHGLLVYSANARDASVRFRSETERSGAVCASITTFRVSPRALLRLEKDKSELYLDPEGGISLRSFSGTE